MELTKYISVCSYRESYGNVELGRDMQDKAAEYMNNALKKYSTMEDKDHLKCICKRAIRWGIKRARRDYLRRLRNEPIPVDNIDIYPSSTADNVEWKLDMERRVARLNDKEKRMLSLRIEGYGLLEIGNMYGMTKQGVDWHLKRVYKKLRRIP